MRNDGETERRSYGSRAREETTKRVGEKNSSDPLNARENVVQC